jgi:hypothetical protein
MRSRKTDKPCPDFPPYQPAYCTWQIVFRLSNRRGGMLCLAGDRASVNQVKEIARTRRLPAAPFDKLDQHKISTTSTFRHRPPKVIGLAPLFSRKPTPNLAQLRNLGSRKPHSVPYPLRQNNDLPLVAKVADMVHTWIFQQNQDQNGSPNREPEGHF